MLFNEYSIIDTLSQSALGKNYKVSKVGSKDFFCLKETKKEPNFNHTRIVQLLKLINHPNIIKFVDFKEDSDNIYIITEFCNGGNLENYLNEIKRPLSEEEVQHVMKQVVDALKYLNENSIVHRDIITSNILINYESEEDLNKKDILKTKIKLIDFGLSTHLNKGNFLTERVGNIKYVAPEILRNKNYDFKVDILSLGVVCSILLAGYFPYDAKALRSDDNINYYLPSTLSKEAFSFVNSMLQYDLNLRKNAEELANHEFLKKDAKEFNKINIEEIKEHIEDSKIKINMKDNQWVSNYLGKK